MVTNEYSCWQTPPLNIMENILRRINLGDRIRLRITCKYWESVVMRRDIRGAPHELPRLLLPQARRYSDCCSCFASAERKKVKLQLPAEVRGSWFYGSSKGWLIMVKQKGLKFLMCLLNPISGALHKLPPLRTIPSFKKFVKLRQRRKGFGPINFLRGVAVLTSCHDINSSGRITVAIVFEDFKAQKTLGLCKLDDLTWSVFQVINNNDSLKLVDILFSRGILYGLVSSQKDGFGLVAATRNLNFGDHELKLILVHDKLEHKNTRYDENSSSDYRRITCADYRSVLLESTNDEVLVIHQMIDFVLQRNHVGHINDSEDGGGNITVDNQEDADQDNAGDEGNYENDHGEGNLVGNDRDGGEDIDYGDPTSFNTAMPTRSFRTYKIDPANNNLVPIQSLGDQVVFFGCNSSISLPASNFPEVKGNCICFATNYPFELASKRYTTREIGIFYLDGERITRPYPSLQKSVEDQPVWFTPSLH